MIFIDVSFVNNRDTSFQINYVVCLADATNMTNILHWSSFKCKKVIRNVLAAKLYAMIYDFDVRSVLKITFTKMFQIIICLILIIDFKSLYDCLIRLDTIVKKRLMINVIILKQSYERREIIEIKWINDENNLANLMIKTKAFLTLKKMIDINQIKLDSEKWVE